MTIFEFKLKMWTNWIVSHHNRPPAPMEGGIAVGTYPTDSNTGDTTCAERPILVKADGATSLAGPAATDSVAVGTAH
jgi:hypothetical protein